MYTILYELSNRYRINVNWTNIIKEILCLLGFSGVLDSQSFLSKTWLVKSINSKLRDTFLQRWIANIETTSNNNFYKIFKTTFHQSEY